MSEFPITLDTVRAAVSLRAAHHPGRAQCAARPEQSGSMRAIDAIRAGVASCLCSDYQPSTMIAAAHAVASRRPIWSLPQAVALVTANLPGACGSWMIAAASRRACAPI